ncbi:hypothetical protein LIER_43717 [Lithospermum erythrorhizon]|uniref:Uncharacterized protein n=1 Tax=Lithospermum erythrorhizon TaxID=34254 RepID=A0AAV3QN82_LITER
MRFFYMPAKKTAVKKKPIPRILEGATEEPPVCISGIGEGPIFSSMAIIAISPAVAEQTIANNKIAHEAIQECSLLWYELRGEGDGINNKSHFIGERCMIGYVLFWAC